MACRTPLLGACALFLHHPVRLRRRTHPLGALQLLCPGRLARPAATSRSASACATISSAPINEEQNRFNNLRHVHRRAHRSGVRPREHHSRGRWAFRAATCPRAGATSKLSERGAAEELASTSRPRVGFAWYAQRRQETGGARRLRHLLRCHGQQQRQQLRHRRCSPFFFDFALASELDKSMVAHRRLPHRRHPADLLSARTFSAYYSPHRPASDPYTQKYSLNLQIEPVLAARRHGGGLPPASGPSAFPTLVPGNTPPSGSRHRAGTAAPIPNVPDRLLDYYLPVSRFELQRLWRPPSACSATTGMDSPCKAPSPYSKVDGLFAGHRRPKRHRPTSTTPYNYRYDYGPY